MQVHMIEHTCAGWFPQVDPHVDPVRAIGFGQRDLGKSRQLDKLAQFLVRGSSERRDVTIWNDQQMAVVVGVKVEDDIAGLAAEDDQCGLIECRLFRIRGTLP